MAGMEDDEDWLYGENAEGKKSENGTATANSEGEKEGENDTVSKNIGDDDDIVPEENKNGEGATDDDGRMITDIVDGLEEGTVQTNNDVDDEGGSDDDDSDDDVQVTIGDIKSAPSFGYGSTPVNLNIKRSGGFAGASVGVAASKPKGIDLETIGTINGIAVYEFNLDSLEDKPWRKPGADITDYFNYGFNEDTWKIYCERQRKLRIDNNVVGKVHHGASKDQLIPIATVNENSKYATAAVVVGGIPLKKAGPPPGRKMSGSIDVIGGGTPSLPSRRPLSNAKENVIQVLAGRKPFELPPGLAPPPPHLAPTHLPPPNFITTNADGTISIQPPGTIPPPGIPPPNLPPPISGFGDHFPPRFPPPSVAGQFDEHSGFFNGSQGPHGQYEGQNDATEQSWGSSPRNRDRDREGGGRGRERGEHERSYSSWDEGREHYRERSSRGGEEEYERRRHRDYRGKSRERGDRDRGDRDRGSSWDKEHEREDRYERDRDRDRERRHKEHRERGDDRHRERSSRRRHHHENEEEHSRSSRHKHKRSKKEKDEESTAGDAQEVDASEPSEEGAIKDEKIE